MLKVLLYAPHFAEYAMRLADGLASMAEVLLICEKRNLVAECSAMLVARLSKRFMLATFDASAGILTGPYMRQVHLPFLISQFQPDIAHLQEQADKPTAAMLRRLARSIPVVLTVHDPRPHNGSDAVYAACGAAYIDQLRAGATGYHVHGAFCEQQLRTTCSVHRPLISTPHGVLLVPEPIARRACDNGSLLFFGRMEAYKGLESLLDATDHLRNQGCVFHLIIAGQGPELLRLASRLKSTDIELHDCFVNHDDAIALFQRAAIVVAPYSSATQSGIVASAYGNRRPVVASAVGGLSDAVANGRDGLLVPPNDPVALAAALSSLLLGDTNRLGSGVHAKASSELNWDNIAKKLIGFYQELITRHPN